MRLNWFTELRVTQVGYRLLSFRDFESILHEVKYVITEMIVAWIGEVYSVFGDLECSLDKVKSLFNEFESHLELVKYIQCWRLGE